MSASISNYRSNQKPFIEHCSPSPNKPHPTSNQYYSHIIAPSRGSQQHFQSGASLNSPSVSSTDHQIAFISTANSNSQHSQKSQVSQKQKQHLGKANDVPEEGGGGSQHETNYGSYSVEGAIGNSNLYNNNNNTKLTDILSTRFSQGTLKFVRNGLANQNTLSNNNNYLNSQIINQRQVSTDTKQKSSAVKLNLNAKQEQTNSPMHNNAGKVLCSSLLSHSIQIQQNQLQSQQISSQQNKQKPRETSSQHGSLYQKQSFNNQIISSAGQAATTHQSISGGGFSNKNNFYGNGLNAGQQVSSFKDSNKLFQNEGGKPISSRIGLHKNEPQISESVKRQTSFLKRSDNENQGPILFHQTFQPSSSNQSSYFQQYQSSLHNSNQVSQSTSQQLSLLAKQNRQSNNTNDNLSRQPNALIQQGKHQASQSVERFGEEGVECKNDNLSASQKSPFNSKMAQKKEQNEDQLFSQKPKPKKQYQQTNNNLAGHVISYSRNAKQGSPDISGTNSFYSKVGTIRNSSTVQPAGNISSNHQILTQHLQHQSSLPQTNSSSYNLVGEQSHTSSSAIYVPSNTANHKLTHILSDDQGKQVKGNATSNNSNENPLLIQITGVQNGNQTSQLKNNNQANSIHFSDSGKSDKSSLNKSLHSSKGMNNEDNQAYGQQGVGNTSNFLKGAFLQGASRIQETQIQMSQKQGQNLQLYSDSVQINHKQMRDEKSIEAERSSSQKRQEQHSVGGRRTISRGSLSEEFKMSQQSYQNLIQSGNGESISTPASQKGVLIDHDSFQDLQPFSLIKNPQQLLHHKQNYLSPQQQTQASAMLVENIFNHQPLSLQNTPSQQAIQQNQFSHQSQKHQIYFLQDTNSINLNKISKISSRSKDCNSSNKEEEGAFNNRKSDEQNKSKRKIEKPCSRLKNLNYQNPQTSQLSNSALIENHSSSKQNPQLNLNIMSTNFAKVEKSLLSQLKSLQQNLQGGFQKTEETQPSPEKNAFSQRREKRNSLQIFQTTESYLGDLNTNKSAGIVEQQQKIQQQQQLQEQLLLEDESLVKKCQKIIKEDDQITENQSLDQLEINQSDLQENSEEKGNEELLDKKQLLVEKEQEKNDTQENSELQEINQNEKIEQICKDVELKRDVFKTTESEMKYEIEYSLYPINKVKHNDMKYEMKELEKISLKSKSILNRYQQQCKIGEENQIKWNEERKSFINSLLAKDLLIQKQQEETQKTQQELLSKDQQISLLQQQLEIMQSQLKLLENNHQINGQSMPMFQASQNASNFIKKANSQIIQEQLHKGDESFGGGDCSADFCEEQNTPLENSFEELKKKYQVRKESISLSTGKSGSRWKYTPSSGPSSQLSSAQKIITKKSSKNVNQDNNESPALNDSFALLQNLAKSQGNSNNKNNMIKTQEDHCNSVPNKNGQSNNFLISKSIQFPKLQENLSFNENISFTAKESADFVTPSPQKTSEQYQYHQRDSSPQLGNHIQDIQELEVIQTSFSPETFQKVQYDYAEQNSEEKDDNHQQRFGIDQGNNQIHHLNPFESFQQQDCRQMECNPQVDFANEHAFNQNHQKQDINIFLKESFAQNINENSFSDNQQPNLYQEQRNSENHFANSSFEVKQENDSNQELSPKLNQKEKQEWINASQNCLENSFGDNSNNQIELNLENGTDLIPLSKEFIEEQNLTPTQKDEEEKNISFTNLSFG